MDDWVNWILLNKVRLLTQAMNGLVWAVFFPLLNRDFFFYQIRSPIDDFHFSGISWYFLYSQEVGLYEFYGLLPSWDYMIQSVISWWRERNALKEKWKEKTNKQKKKLTLFWDERISEFPGHRFLVEILIINECSSTKRDCCSHDAESAIGQ